MKIAVISTPVFQLGVSGLQGYGGLEMIAWQRAKGLAELGHRVKLVAPDGSICPGVEVVPCGPAGRIDEKRAYLRWREAVLDCDVLIDDSWGKLAYAAKMEGRFKGPVLAVMHAPVDTMLRSFPPGIDKPSVVCISNDQARHFEVLFNRPARVAYNGVDPDAYKPLEIPRTDRYLFLARFSSIKGPDIAIDACLKAGACLDLVGDVSITGEPDYFERCRRACDGVKVRMVGPATRGNAVWWFSQARGFLHPAKRFREPFGLAPVESMLCGTPVLAFDNGAMRETVAEGISGSLVRTEEEFADAVRSGRLDNIDRKACREWATQFSVDRMARRYEELCVEALDTGGW